MNSETLVSSRLVLIAFVGLFSGTYCCAQDFDGVVRKPQQLLGQPAVIAPRRGPVASGLISEIFQPKNNPLSVLHFEIKTTSGRTRQFKPNQIDTIQIATKEMGLVPHLPSRTYQLVDIADANKAIDTQDLRN